MSRIAAFRTRLEAGEPLIGTFVKTPSSIVCEVLARTAMDLLCLDAEHAPFDRTALDACLAVTRLADVPTLVRVPAAEPAQVLNALDGGATGIVAPHVTTAAGARGLARSARFGAGGRGYAGSTRAADFGARTMAAHLQASAAETVVVAQIEDVTALEAIDEIAAVDGIDCLFVGRMDLTVALGAASANAPEVVDAVETICAAARKARRRIGMFVPDPAELARWRARGASLFLLASDQQFLTAGANALAHTLRDE